ncbi:helix-turn-helix domain-containing protein [Dubosiella newyorkensis]|uniref:helix-turn-helix domain-containing protein n=1 Tax=Dubosiella newyorkensis TaxID=1862672 RepID=UPI003F66B8AC
MKANEVMKILQISRSTLLRWRKEGILKANKLPSGEYAWDERFCLCTDQQRRKTGSVSLCTSIDAQRTTTWNQMETCRICDEAGYR